MDSNGTVNHTISNHSLMPVSTTHVQTTRMFTTLSANENEMENAAEVTTTLLPIILLVAVGIILIIIIVLYAYKSEQMMRKKSTMNPIENMIEMADLRNNRDVALNVDDTSINSALHSIYGQGTMSMRPMRVNTFSSDGTSLPYTDTNVMSSDVLTTVCEKKAMPLDIFEDDDSSHSSLYPEQNPQIDMKQDEHDQLEQIRECKQFGIQQFESILSIQNTEERRRQLINPLNWEKFINSIYLNMPGNDIEAKIKILKGMQTVTQNISNSNYKRYNHIERHKFDQKYGAIDGGLLFFKGIGFRDDLRLNGLVCVEPDFAINEVAIGCLLHIIKFFELQAAIQRLWSKCIRKLSNHTELNNDMNYDALKHISSMDLIGDHSDYCKLSMIVKDIHQINILTDTNDANAQNQIARELLIKLGFKFDTDFSYEHNQDLMQDFFNLCTQIAAMEQMKKERAMYIQSVVEPIQEYQLGGPSDIEKDPSLIKAQTTANAFDSVAEFGAYWSSEYDESFRKQALTDDEIAQIYESGNIDKVEDGLLRKLHEMKANQFQMDEYLSYMDHSKDLNKLCMDKKCEWNKKLYKNKLYLLTRTQLVHVMLYHSKGTVHLLPNQKMSFLGY